jgi:hypothetical protein
MSSGTRERGSSGSYARLGSYGSSGTSGSSPSEPPEPLEVPQVPEEPREPRAAGLRLCLHNAVPRAWARVAATAARCAYTFLATPGAPAPTREHLVP